MTKQIITANRLTDGRVIYLAPDDNWVENVNAARVVDAAAAEALLAEVKAANLKGQWIDPLLIDVEVTPGQVRPTSLREAIRAAGPTTGNSRRSTAA